MKRMTKIRVFKRQLKFFLKYYHVPLEKVELSHIDDESLCFSFWTCPEMRRLVWQEYENSEDFGFKSRHANNKLAAFTYHHGYRFEFVSWNMVAFLPPRQPKEQMEYEIAKGIFF